MDTKAVVRAYEIIKSRADKYKGQKGKNDFARGQMVAYAEAAKILRTAILQDLNAVNQFDKGDK